MTITVFGSANVDITAYVTHLPRPGETAHALRQSTGIGGKGANQAVAAQRLAADPVRFIAAIGDDAFGDFFTRGIAEYGLSPAALTRVPDSATGMALIHVDAKAENTITVLGGANMAWKESSIDQKHFTDARVVLLQLEVPLAANITAMHMAKKSDATVILDPAPMPDTDISDLLAGVDILTPNAGEAEALAGHPVTNPSEARDAVAALLARGPKTVVITLGQDGLAYGMQDGDTGTIPAFKVDAIDSVAAGDCFNGALAVALAERLHLPDALRFAAAAGALATTRPGASAAAPARDEVEKLFKKA